MPVEMLYRCDLCGDNAERKSGWSEPKRVYFGTKDELELVSLKDPARVSYKVICGRCLEGLRKELIKL